MTAFVRMEPNDPGVPEAVARALETMADYVGIAREGECVLFAAMGFGAIELKIITAAIVDLVRGGSLWLIHAGQLGAYLIASSEAPRYTIKSSRRRPAIIPIVSKLKRGRAKRPA